MLSMGESSSLSGVGILGPFDTLYEQPKPHRFIFKMPRVVPDQKHKFETDEIFRRLSRESEVRYTGYRDRPMEERQTRFQNGCREGHTEIAFTATGTNIQLLFNSNANGYHLHKYHHHHHPQHLSNDSSGASSPEIDFDKEHGKVHIRSHLIMNGVCVCWRGWLDLERLDGVGCLEFDEEHAPIEDALLRDQIQRYNQRIRDYEERQRPYRGSTLPGHSERRGSSTTNGASNATSDGNSHGQSMQIFSSV